MPTDGTLFLENVPRKKQYLLTALSVFFSLGAVVSAIIAIIIIPGNSCPEVPTTAPENSTSTSFVKLVRALVSRAATPSEENTPQLCDVATQNRGWKYLLGLLGIIVCFSVLVNSSAKQKHVTDTCDVRLAYYFLPFVRVA
jgi:hypothetical protein